jgi:hypothetical protein
MSDEHVSAAAMGFRVKSGWATAVLLGAGASAGSPRVLDRRTVELSDPEVPETRQPYHGGTGREETDSAKIRRRIGIVERIARRSVTELLDGYRRMAGKPLGAGLVVGSVIEPERIANPHIRAHALEGQLFRTVLQETLAAHGIACRISTERKLPSEAAALLGRSESAIRGELVALGRGVGRPWAADDKLAALAAWMVVAAGAGRRGARTTVAAPRTAPLRRR